MEERFELDAAWCNSCRGTHAFKDFIKAGKGVSFKCVHDSNSDTANLQNKFFKRLMKDLWFTADRHKWSTVGEIIKRAIARGLDPDSCDLLIAEEDTDGAEFTT